jgi:tRNA(adenine34) deaminase
LSQVDAARIMREALRLASAALEQGELPIGAVVVLDNRIIAAAYTREKAEKRRLVHADLLALEAADRLQPFPGRREDVKLFVNLEPCLMCLGAAMSFRVGEVYYGLESPGDGAVALVQKWQRDERQAPFYGLPKIHGGILRQESVTLFREYSERHPAGPKAEWARTLAEL